MKASLSVLSALHVPRILKEKNEKFVALSIQVQRDMQLWESNFDQKRYSHSVPAENLEGKRPGADIQYLTDVLEPKNEGMKEDMSTRYVKSYEKSSHDMNSDCAHLSTYFCTL